MKDVMLDCLDCQARGVDSKGDPCKRCNGTGQYKRPPPEYIECPECDGSKVMITHPDENEADQTVKEERCWRCLGVGKVTSEAKLTNVVHLPKNATLIPKEDASKAKKEFRRWKQTFVHMINRECQIEWRRKPDGEFSYKFILPTELCKIVYEVQVNERIRAQMEHAANACKAKGLVMPSVQEIERIALANLQQEFMSHTMATMAKLQQPAKDAKPAEEEKAGPTEEEEAAAGARLQEMREQLVKGGQIVDVAGDKIKAELARREKEPAHVCTGSDCECGESEPEKDN